MDLTRRTQKIRGSVTDPTQWPGSSGVLPQFPFSFRRSVNHLPSLAQSLGHMLCPTFMEVGGDPGDDLTKKPLPSER